MISYATDKRKKTDKFEGDYEGAGPGIQMCHALVMALHDRGIPCWTGLVSCCSWHDCTPARPPRLSFCLLTTHPVVRPTLITTTSMPKAATTGRCTSTS